MLSMLIKRDLDIVDSLLELRMNNVYPNSVKLICFKHETYWADNCNRLLRKHGPYLYLDNTIVQSSTTKEADG